MKDARIALVLLFVFLLGACAADKDYSSESFNSQFNKMTEESDVVELCRDFLSHADSIEVLRTVQSTWEDFDAEAVRTFCQTLAEKNTRSAVYQYLYGRMVENPIERITIGRKIIELDPQWPYGYRLILATYTTELFNKVNRPDSGEYTDELALMLPSDEKYFQQLVDLEPGQGYPRQFMFGYQEYKHNFDNALTLLQEGEAAGADWADERAFAVLYVHMDDMEKARAAVEKFADKLITAGWPAEERDSYVERFYTSALTSAGAYQKAVDYVKGQKGYKRDQGKLYDLACYYSRLGDKDNAFKYLNQSATQGWDQIVFAQEDKDLANLVDDPRWEEVIAAFQANWDKGKDERKQAALAAKVDLEAPDWALPDVDGDTVRLVDLRGFVVVLDFWATWCSPCRMAMPMIDDFVRNHAAEDVRVFSVNVWEGGKFKPAKFMKDNDYAMTLIYGDKALTDAYYVEGIPHLVVIDREGHQRYIGSGVHQGLEEQLIWWTEDLL